MTESTPTPRQNISWQLMLLTIFIMLCTVNSLCFIFYLTTVPDLAWQRGDATYDRIFIVRTSRPAGIGLERQRLAETDSPDTACVTTRVNYFMWNPSPETSNQDSVFSQLYQQTPQGWQPTGQPCP